MEDHFAYSTYHDYWLHNCPSFVYKDDQTVSRHPTEPLSQQNGLKLRRPGSNKEIDWK